MGRSVKKGPFVQPVLLKRIQEMNKAGSPTISLITSPRRRDSSFFCRVLSLLTFHWLVEVFVSQLYVVGTGSMSISICICRTRINTSCSWGVWGTSMMLESVYPQLVLQLEKLALRMILKLI